MFLSTPTLLNLQTPDSVNYKYPMHPPNSAGHPTSQRSFNCCEPTSWFAFPPLSTLTCRHTTSFDSIISFVWWWWNTWRGQRWHSQTNHFGLRGKLSKKLCTKNKIKTNWNPHSFIDMYFFYLWLFCYWVIAQFTSPILSLNSHAQPH